LRFPVAKYIYRVEEINGPKDEEAICYQDFTSLRKAKKHAWKLAQTLPYQVNEVRIQRMEQVHSIAITRSDGSPLWKF
jgi:competence protein ComGF